MTSAILRFCFGVDPYSKSTDEVLERFAFFFGSCWMLVCTMEPSAAQVGLQLYPAACQECSNTSIATIACILFLAAYAVHLVRSRPKCSASNDCLYGLEYHYTSVLSLPACLYIMLSW